MMADATMLVLQAGSCFRFVDVRMMGNCLILFYLISGYAASRIAEIGTSFFWGEYLSEMWAHV